MEALIHYSLGKSSERRGGHGRIRLLLPGLRDGAKLLLIVLIFALLAFVTNLGIDKLFLETKAAE
ncbi:MAG TPA: hypothetical protein EYP98_20175 [Planctomycetes bacterium]|nr:hypothetical protein [Planctomycetota bacterium]